MADSIRDLLEQQDDEINADTVRSHAAWVRDAIPHMQALADSLDGLAFSLDEGDPDEGAVDAATRALDDVEQHGVVID